MDSLKIKLKINLNIFFIYKIYINSINAKY